MAGLSFQHGESSFFIPLSGLLCYTIDKPRGSNGIVVGSTEDGIFLYRTPHNGQVIVGSQRPGLRFETVVEGPGTQNIGIVKWGQSSYALSFVEAPEETPGTFAARTYYGENGSWSTVRLYLTEVMTEIISSSIITSGSKCFWKTKGVQSGMLSDDLFTEELYWIVRPGEEGTWEIGLIEERISAVVITADLLCLYQSDDRAWVLTHKIIFEIRPDLAAAEGDVIQKKISFEERPLPVAFYSTKVQFPVIENNRILILELAGYTLTRDWGAANPLVEVWSVLKELSIKRECEPVRRRRIVVLDDEEVLDHEEVLDDELDNEDELDDDLVDEDELDDEQDDDDDEQNNDDEQDDEQDMWEVLEIRERSFVAHRAQPPFNLYPAVELLFQAPIYVRYQPPADLDPYVEFL